MSEPEQEVSTPEVVKEHAAAENIGSGAYLPILEAAVFGFIAGIAAVALSQGVNALGALRIELSTKYPAIYVLPAFGFVGGALAGLMVQRIAPEASGSGIPQVRAALDRLKMRLDWRIAVVKLFGGTIALGSGLFMGREGPTVQLGAAIAATLGKYAPGARQYRRQLIAAGAGAGLAAAFNAPLAGAVFVLEELLKEMKPTTVAIALAASSAAALALNLLPLPEAHASAHLLASQIFFRGQDLPFYILLAAVCALAGKLFNDGILLSLNTYRRAKFLPVALKVGLAGLASGLLMATTPEAFHDYANLRGLIVAGVENWQTVAIAVLEFYFLTLVAYGSGAPGGLFAPSLAIGASLGFLTGSFENCVLPGASTAAFSLVGMGAFFAAVARVPLTAIVITFELTGNFTLLVPLMISCLGASAVGEWISTGSLYERLMEWNGLHLRRQQDSANKEGLARTMVLDLYVKHVATVAPDTRVKDMIASLTEQRYQGLAVVQKGILVGVVRQENMTDLLHLEEISNDLKVNAVMTPNPVSVSPLESLEEILHLFTHHHFNWLPVTENDKFYGVIYQDDVVKTLFSTVDMEATIAPAALDEPLILEEKH
ncbi:MAG: chloride channel protein [Cyanobacteria bacterium REEB67]|nr:chloride channel protein [Cyanobacteria bacterium REEB67]